MRERFIPRVLAAEPESFAGGPNGAPAPAKVRDIAMRNEKPGGHGDRAAAVGALELAFWDLAARAGEEPAWATIARHFGTTPHEQGCAVYAAGGYYYAPGDGMSLGDEMRGYVDRGFRAAKMKIGGASPAEDMARIEEAVAVLGSPGQLAVDANGRFTPDEAMARAAELDPLGLRWIEEMGDPLDYALNARLTGAVSTPVATGENLFSRQDLANLLRFGGARPGIDVFQMDAGLSYGLTDYAGMIADLEAAGHARDQAMPHGGHLINLHIVAGLGLGGCEAYPNVFLPFGGYAPQCRLEEGRIHPSDAPGFGLEQKPELAPLIDEITA